MILAELDSITKLRLGTVLWTWGVFLVTLFLLSKIAWPMLLKKMEERELHISEGLKKAEEAEERARELAERQEHILEEARKESQALIAESRQAAENQRAQMMEAAQHEIAAERERAKREIELERTRAIEELRETTVDLTLMASSHLLAREIGDDDHRRLTQGLIDDLLAGESAQEVGGPR